MSLAISGAVVGTVAGAAIASRGARKASDTQAAAADRANEVSAEIAREQMGMQRGQFDRQEILAREQMARDRQIYDESIARQEPFRQAGLSGLQQYQNLIRNPFQYDQNAFSTERIMNDPGVAFRREQGQQQLDRRLAGTGNLYSGAALKEAQRFGQGLASQEYGNAYSRAADGEARRKDAYQLQSNQFASLAGIGQTANSASQVAGQNYGQATAGQTNALGQFGAISANQSANALGNYGNAFSNNTIGAANARAGNSMYQGNAWANAMNQGISAYGRSGGGSGWGMGNAFRSLMGTGGAGAGYGTGSVQGNSDYEWDL